jgi:hypothetical protein
MIRRARMPIATAIVFAIVAAVPAIASAAGTAGSFADDDPDETLPLMVTADFNGDGIADVAEVSSPDGAPSGVRYLTILLGRGNGVFRQAASRPVLGPGPPFDRRRRFQWGRLSRRYCGRRRRVSY